VAKHVAQGPPGNPQQERSPVLVSVGALQNAREQQPLELPQGSGTLFAFSSLSL
jgi:hypothetical protein